MNILNSIYRDSLALLTDFYQLSMAYGYWKTEKRNARAVFSLFFRENPFEGGYTIAAGLEQAIDFLERFSFSDQDLEYLSGLKGSDDKPIFDKAFLDYLAKLELSCDIDAVEEGDVVFPHESLIRVKGPIIQCQLLETPLLTILNFQSLIATKAARVCQAAKDQPVLEFGLRRAHGIDGGLSVSRAAYIGGCAATSNVLAGKLYNIPVKGTHAHSWVMTFDNEMESFRAYAEAQPNNCIFLVDTYDTIQGVKNAVEMGKVLREKGHEMVGVRLDSGDLAYLSIEARRIMDEAGFKDARIFASNDLDENIILSLNDQDAKIDVWGVGTKLATAYDQPALGGVYKLTALKENGEWQYKLKLSEQAIKISNPGIMQIRRFEKDGEYKGDAIYDERLGVEESCTIVDPVDATRRKTFSDGYEKRDLLQPVFRDGKCVYKKPSLEEIREKRSSVLKKFHRGIKRFVNPHQYPVGLEEKLHELKTRLVLEARGHVAKEKGEKNESPVTN